MSAGEDIDDLLARAIEAVRAMGRSMPATVEIFGPRSKTPYVLLCVREAQAHRAEEFARNACKCFVRQDIVVGITNTRGFVESLAAVFYVKWLMEAAVNQGVQPDLHQRAVALSVGHRRGDPELPTAVNVLTMIGKVDNDFPGFQDQYDRMSEFAHPNWGGALGVYGKRDKTTHTTHFGKNLRENPFPAELGVRCLSTALMLWEYTYNKISDLMPEFVDACERALPPEGEAPVADDDQAV